MQAAKSNREDLQIALHMIRIHDIILFFYTKGTFTAALVKRGR